MTALAAAAAFARRDFAIARSYRLPFVMGILGSAMSLITFRFIAELVGDAEAIRATGDYFAFVVVGMMMAQVLEATLSAPAKAARQEQVQGTLEVLATQPMRASAWAAAWGSYPILNALVMGGALLLLAWPLGLRLHDPNWLIAVPAIALSAAIFAGLGLLAAAVVLVLQQSAGMTRWMGAAMALISGVFFPVSLLPAWVQTLAQASPMTHSLRAVRGSLLAGQDAAALAGDLLALAAFAIVLLPSAILVLGVALRRARAKGTIATY